MSDISGLSEGLKELLRSLWSLRLYLPELTLIGGWIPELYKRFGGIQDWRSSLSQTREADVLVGLRLNRDGRPTIAEALEYAGFRPLDGPMAAVWVHETPDGARIEFLTGLDTPAMQQARTVPIGDQPGLGALPLPADLNLLERHTRLLDASWEDRGEQRNLQIKVPELAAFAINKALTARRRASTQAPTERGPKDILYLHDLLSAGSEVVAEIRFGLRRMLASTPTDRRQILAAVATLRALTSADIFHTAEMLAERDRIDLKAAQANVRGYVQDLIEILEEESQRER